MLNQFELEGYMFENRNDYIKAKKDLEVITYIRNNSDLNNTTLVLKIYNRLVDKGTFQTIIGYVFLNELQQKMLNDRLIPKDKVRPIQIKQVKPVKVKVQEENRCEEAKQADNFKMLYEKERAKKISTKIVIAFLLCTIIGMLVTAQLTPYSLFTNYEEKIVDKYENWQAQLEQKERELDQREQALIEKK